MEEQREREKEEMCQRMREVFRVVLGNKVGIKRGKGREENARGRLKMRRRKEGGGETGRGEEGETRKRDTRIRYRLEDRGTEREGDRPRGKSETEEE